MIHFGEHIRTLREKRKLLLRELAANLNMDVAYLSKIERGNRMARREQVVAFAKELNEDEKDSTVILKIAKQKISSLTKKTKK